MSLPNVADTYLYLMLCPLYQSVGNGKCDEANNKLVCLYDGGDCKDIHGCKSVECIEDQEYDPCPKYDKISNGQCDVENDNFICAFDGGDCQIG